MKLAITLIGLIVSAAAFAGNSKLVHGSVSGWVTVKQSATLTCLAMGCPPSKRYFEVSLVDAQVEGFGAVESIVLQDLPKTFDLKKAPKYYTYGGVKIQAGQWITLEGDVLLYPYPNRTFGFLTRGTDVVVPRIQPRR